MSEVKSEVEQELTAVMPASVHSGTATPKESENIPSEINKMASSGQEELFKTGDVAVIVDQKHSTGNQDLFRSGFAKSEKESDIKSMQQDIKSMQQMSQRQPTEGQKSSKQTSKQKSQKSMEKQSSQPKSKKKSASGHSPEASEQRSINQSQFRTMSNFRNSRMSQQKSEKRQGSIELTAGERAERVAQLSPLKSGAKVVSARFNYALDNEEREIIARGRDLSKQEIWALLEKKRFGELKKASVNLQGQLLTQQRCPKCTLLPPCKHYKSPQHLANEAQRYVYSTPFREVMKGSQRENLLHILKQQSQAQLQLEQQHDSQFYLETLQGGEDGGPHTLSVNRFDGQMPVPVPMPQQDLEYESQHNFKQKRNSTRPRPNQRLEPLKVKQTDFLRRGGGNGGSPTTHAVSKKASETGQIQLSPIARKAAQTNVRVRGKAGDYQYVSAGSIHSNSPGKQGEMSPRQRKELQKKNRTQQKIAEFRMMKYQIEQEKIQKEQEEAEEQRQKLIEAQERRANYMQSQKARLQEYQIQRALAMSQQAAREEEEMRMHAEREAQRRAQEQYERKKALANWQAEKRKAEQMLLMANNPENPMKEQFEDEEYSVENEPQKQVFEQNQNKEFAIEDDKSSSKQRSKKYGGATEEDDQYSEDGYSGIEAASSVAKSKAADKKNLTAGNFNKKIDKSEDDGYSSVKNTDNYSIPKSSKSGQPKGVVAKKGEPSESHQYTQENYEDEFSQGTSENKQSAKLKTEKPGNMISGGQHLANPPSMAQLQQDSGAKTDGTHPQNVHQDSIEESDRIMVGNDSQQKDDNPKFTYHKLDGSPGVTSNEIGEEIDNPSYSGFDQNSKNKDGKSVEGKSNDEFFLDEENISVNN